MTPARQRTLTIGLIVVGILIVGFFGLRTLRAFREFRGHRPPPFSPAEAQQVETDVELIRDWMTIPFISKMYHVPPHVLFEALNIPPEGNQEKSLNDLNREYYPKENGIVLEKVKAAVLANQPQQIPTARSAPTFPPPAP